MSKRYTQVPLDYLEPIFDSWRRVFDEACVGNVFFHPKGDSLPRAMQFVDWMTEKYNSKAVIVNMEVDLDGGHDDLKEFLEENRHKQIIIIAKKSFMGPPAAALAGVIEEWYTKYGSGLLIFHEGFPLQLVQYTDKPAMMQKHIVHKIYPREVVRKFAQNIADLLDFKIDDLVLDKIVSYCGGVLWFVKDVVRRLKDNDQLFQSQIFWWKVEQVAKDIPKINGIENDITRMGLIGQNGEWIPVLADYFNKCAKSSLIIENDYISLDARDHTSYFSHGELKILHKLHETSEVVSRDELSSVFWSEKGGEDYSDWALDAIMSRLRKKLIKLRIPLQIYTKRGKGYECR